MEFGDFQLHIVQESHFKLDAGSMFGVVPKALWQKECMCDMHNKMQLTCNLLVIQTKEKNILVETGMGSRWSTKEKERYNLETLVNPENILESIGLKHADINAVIVSHLHFDHIGGALYEQDSEILPNFPNAKIYVQKGEWEFAQKANARAKASYRLSDFIPLMKEGLIELIDGNKEIFPGINLILSGGHTSYHQIVTFESQNKKGIFFGDLIPTKAHISPAWVMSYDHFPLDSCDMKEKWLKTVSCENYLVVLDHEISVPWGYINLKRHENIEKYEWNPLPGDTLKNNFIALI